MINENGELVNSRTIDWNAVPAKKFPYRIRQAPGPENALGDVKFMFPNCHNVYLHDTPTRGLFAQTRRDFPSGCVRVQDALDLAAWVLSDSSDWASEKINNTAAGNTETRVTLIVVMLWMKVKIIITATLMALMIVLAVAAGSGGAHGEVGFGAAASTCDEVLTGCAMMPAMSEKARNRLASGATPANADLQV